MKFPINRGKLSAHKQEAVLREKEHPVEFKQEAELDPRAGLTRGSNSKPSASHQFNHTIKNFNGMSSTKITKIGFSKKNKLYGRAVGVLRGVKAWTEIGGVAPLILNPCTRRR